ncbi:hypothetical protein DRW03_04900 [Corallococcus sp. H22C18031201]|uniref:hypothetical protein n=1 Tax=Citreicoccus inhibens TaxID=2849499 RepID=UPI000E748FE3|nr:hypothetical protein [Citreicoccus inhibens]MBU8900659.1 hypothetical protein [Citreicoccus inhibens]RJS25815.1 hypothetical protein DRW03_04900 [Corallococcus sp. H22C18031201]
MRRPLRFLGPFVALCLSACSLLVDFDPEGQPCDKGQCLPGYVCQNDVCVPGESDGGSDSGLPPALDAGKDAGTDAGRDGGSDAG